MVTKPGTSEPSGLILLGTSHVGKSTCARALGQVLGWQVVSTDKLGRHPGRPWTATSEFVSDFYVNLSNEAIYWFLRVHHDNIRPLIHDRVCSLLTTGDKFVLEGSAIRPEYLAEWELGNVRSVCLHIDSTTLRNRIASAADRSKLGDQMKSAVDKFIERSVRDNQELVSAAKSSGIGLLDVTNVSSVDDAIQMVQKAFDVRSWNDSA